MVGIGAFRVFMITELNLRVKDWVLKLSLRNYDPSQSFKILGHLNLVDKI